MKTHRIVAEPTDDPRSIRSSARGSESGPRPLRDRIEVLDAVLAIFSAGLSARLDTATPSRAAALATVATSFADAASALAVEAATMTAEGPGRRDADQIARAAAGLQVRTARLRLRMVEYRSKGLSRGRR